MYKKQGGQVLPLGLAMLVLSMLGAFLVFNTGQLATEKMRLANAADAAAYSGALWQARALNFQAYANRAMVANQVAVAQIVSLRSWSAYGAVTSENIATVLKGVPLVNAIATGVETGFAAFQQVVAPLTKALVPLLDTVNQILSVSQNIMYVGTFVAVPDVVNAIVEQSDPRFSAVTGYSALGMADNLAQWQRFTQRYDKFDRRAMDSRARMINDSRDGFTRDRSWDFTSLLFPPNLFIKQEVIREGQTRLVRRNTTTGPEWEWKAKDTVSLHTRIRYLFGSKRIELPIGWAQAFANSRNQRRTLESGGCGFNAIRCARYTDRNKKAERLSDIGIPSPVKRLPTNIPISGYGGIRSFNSLSRSTIQSDDPRLQLKVEVSMPANQAASAQARSTQGNFDTPEETAAGSVSSLSIAEVYFQPPDFHQGSGGKAERANGYNPYWQSRLADVSLADRLWAFSLR